jgi:hypothetical protein
MTAHEDLENAARDAGYGVQRETAYMTITKDVGVADVNQVRVFNTDDGSFSHAVEVNPSGAVLRSFTSAKAVRDHLDL